MSSNKLIVEGQVLTPRQRLFIKNYSDPKSSSFSNCYQSAVSAGYSDQTARNLTHVRPQWLLETIGQTAAINPDEITRVLTGVIYSDNEPTIIRLKAIEMMMKHYNMLKQNDEYEPKVLQLSIDLSGANPPPA